MSESEKYFAEKQNNFSKEWTVKDFQTTIITTLLSLITLYYVVYYAFRPLYNYFIVKEEKKLVLQKLKEKLSSQVEEVSDDDLYQVQTKTVKASKKKISFEELKQTVNKSKIEANKLHNSDWLDKISESSNNVSNQLGQFEPTSQRITTNANLSSITMASNSHGLVYASEVPPASHQSSLEYERQVRLEQDAAYEASLREDTEKLYIEQVKTTS